MPFIKKLSVSQDRWRTGGSQWAYDVFVFTHLTCVEDCGTPPEQWLAKAMMGGHLMRGTGRGFGKGTGLFMWEEGRVCCKVGDFTLKVKEGMGQRASFTVRLALYMFKILKKHFRILPMNILLLYCLSGDGNFRAGQLLVYQFKVLGWNWTRMFDFTCGTQCRPVRN